MCSRYYIDSNIADDIPDIRGADNWRNRVPGDIRPTDMAPVITGENGELHLEEQSWGFKAAYDGKLIINARAETVLEKKMFSESALHRRIVVPARLFYEWDPEKQKVSFFKEDKKTMYMAGLFRDEPTGRKYTIITTSANASMKQVHDRMPFLIGRDLIRDWIFDDTATGEILSMVPEELCRSQEYRQMSLFDLY